MKKRGISAEELDSFCQHLRGEERSAATIEKYRRDVAQFAAWLGENQLEKEAGVRWKAHLLAQGCEPSTVNGKLTALDRFLHFLGQADCKVKHLKIQRQLFREDGRELNRREYDQLLAAARSAGRERLALLMESICGTGIRVSEVKYLTVEAARRGKVEVALKGKIRAILLPGKLCRKLLKYAGKNKIASGEIFLTRSGASLSRKQIWRDMKALCQRAGVAPSKVFPHNLRHLFARTFYRVCRDVAKLADVLGHSSIETTRIYLLSTGAEHAKVLEQLHLIS